MTNPPPLPDKPRRLKNRYPGSNTLDKAHVGLKCPRCEYDLSGTKGGICPECGETFTYNDLLDHRYRTQYLLPLSIVLAAIGALPILALALVRICAEFAGRPIDELPAPLPAIDHVASIAACCAAPVAVITALAFLGTAYFERNRKAMYLLVIAILGGIAGFIASASLLD